MTRTSEPAGCVDQASGIGCLLFLIGAPGAYLTYRRVAPDGADVQNPFFAMFAAMAVIGLLWCIAILSIAAFGRWLWQWATNEVGDAAGGMSQHRAGATIRTKVVGVTHRNPDGTDRQKVIARHCRAGRQLLLEHEPDNLHDASAIAVYVPVAGRSGIKRLQIGYLRSGLAHDVLGVIEAGSDVVATVLEVTGGDDGKNFGVNIQVDLS